MIGIFLGSKIKNCTFYDLKNTNQNEVKNYDHWLPYKYTFYTMKQILNTP